MKVCKACGIAKPIHDYYRRKSNRDGLELRCKPCFIFYAHNETPLKLVRSVFSDQKRTSLRRNHPLPNYTAEELYSWVTSRPNFRELWDTWVASGRSSKLRPSVDRLSDKSPYTLDNIRLVTWGDNHQKACDEDKTDKPIVTSRPVRGTSLKDGSQHDFISAGQAGRFANSNSSNVAAVANKVVRYDKNGRPYTPRSAGGYSWEWIINKKGD